MAFRGHVSLRGERWLAALAGSAAQPDGLVLRWPVSDLLLQSVEQADGLAFDLDSELRSQLKCYSPNRIHL